MQSLDLQQKTKSQEALLKNMSKLSDGYAVYVKRDCKTCVLIAPVLAEMRAAGLPLKIFSQDDPTFPDGLDDIIDDRALENAFHAEMALQKKIRLTHWR